MANEIDGLHLIVDGLVESPKSVFTQENLKRLLLQLVDDLKMQLIFGPLFHEVEIEESKLTGDVFQDEGGVSGFCMIGTSHISIHVWPLRQHFSMDVFSCKQFDSLQARMTIEKFLDPQHATFTEVRRRQGGLVDEIVAAPRSGTLNAGPVHYDRTA
jgi:S-adenosylmethionine decarboxylase